MFLQTLIPVEGLGEEYITQVASHYEGKHYLALSVTGTVYSWGIGDSGRLGHNNTRYTRRWR